MSLLVALGTVRKAQKRVFIRMCVSSCAQELHHTQLQLESPLSSDKRYAKVLLKKKTLCKSIIEKVLLKKNKKNVS